MQAIGPYRILEPIGSGGMGEVFLAEDTRLGRRVALKRLRRMRAESADQRARLLREARAAAALNHPRIAAVYDILDPAGDADACIVMEYVPGESLDAVLRAGRLPLERVLAIAGEITEALDAAHARGVIHRDLKPANIRLTLDGHVKVLDFGIAKTIASETAVTTDLPAEEAILTRAGNIAGTPAYMSPEQLRGRAVDGRSDIYSFGVVLYEMAAGVRPFKGPDVLTVCLAVLSETPTHARAIDPAIPPRLDALITRMLAKAPSDRPQTADAIAAELSEIARGGAAGRPVAHGRWALAAAALFAALALGVFGWRTVGTGVPADRPVIAVLGLKNLSGDPKKDYLGIGIADTLTTNLARLSSVSVVAPPGGAAGPIDRAKLARDLGANLLLEGSVEQSGDRIHVNAKVVKPNGAVTWAGDSEATIGDLFSLETRLASALIDALQVKVTAAEREELRRPPTSSHDALNEYWQGVALLDRGDNATLDAAIDSLERAIVRDPQFALAHARLGDAYRRKYGLANDRAWMTKALDEVTRAIQIDPGQPDIRVSLAVLYQATGRNGAAVDELRRVLATHPHNDDAHRQLADVLRSEGRQEDAIAELRQTIAIRPNYWRNHQALGLFFYAIGRLPEAVSELTIAARLRPDDGASYQQLGTAYHALGDKTRARENYEHAIRLSPNAAAYSNLGTIHYAEGRYADAAAAYEGALALRPKYALYHRNLGDTYLKLGRRDDARAQYEQAVHLAEEMLTVNPSDAITMGQLAVYEAKVGRYPDARRHVDGAAAINPTSPQLAYYRAVVFALGGDRPAAMKALADAVARGYSVKVAREDDDLASLRGLPDFARVVGAGP